MTPKLPTVMAAPNHARIKARILGLEQSTQYPDKWILQFEILESTALTGPNFAHVGETVEGFTFMNSATLKPQDIVEGEAEYIGGAQGGQFQLTNLKA